MTRRAKLLAAVGATLVLALAVNTGLLGLIWGPIANQAFDVEHSLFVSAAWRTLFEAFFLFDRYIGLLGSTGAMLAIPALVARMVAWKRFREGRPDPLEPLRRHPRLARLIGWGPAALFFLVAGQAEVLGVGSISGDGWAGTAGLLVSVLVPLLAFAAGLGKLGSLGMGELLEPLSEAATPPSRTDGDIVFSAVAVTRRTRAAVGLVGLASVAMALWAVAAPITTLQRSPLFFWVLAVYVASAAGAAFAFRRASRIAVGIDGVFVRDASRTRFFAYCDLDEARAKGHDLDLCRGGEVVLRLQTHGADAGRRDEVVARIAENIAGARSTATRGAEMLVQAMPSRRVASAALGVKSYRDASVSREQLWELIEGATTDAGTRTAAARALATKLDASERTRLRVAAARCAEPPTRIALDMLAVAEDAEADEAPGAAAARVSARTARRRPDSA